MKTLNPILVLAGAAANNGNVWFACELLEIDRGHRDAKAIKKTGKRFSGWTLSSIARHIDSKLQINATHAANN